MYRVCSIHTHSHARTLACLDYVEYSRNNTLELDDNTLDTLALAHSPFHSAGLFIARTAVPRMQNNFWLN